MNRILFLTILFLAVLSLAGCKPRSSEQIPPPAVPQKADQETAAAAASPVQPIPVTRSVTDWIAAGAKFAENKDGSLKSADFSEVSESPAFDPDESERFKTLRVIRGKGSVSDLLVDEVSYCSDLAEFLWVETSLSDQGLSRLALLDKLKKLRLNGLKRTDETAKILALFPALTELDLSASNVTDADVAQLVNGSKNLTKLNLYQTPVGDAAVKELLKIADQLEWLNLDATQITDAAGEDLAQLTHLKFLHIGRTQTTDAFIDSLGKLTQLEKIHITRTGITEEGANQLRAKLPNTEVISVVEEK